MAAAGGGASGVNEDAFHALERRMIVLQRDHERVQTERDDLQRRVADAAAEATQANAKIASLQQALSAQDASGAEQKRVAGAKEHEVTRLTELLTRTNKVSAMRFYVVGDACIGSPGSSIDPLCGDPTPHHHHSSESSNPIQNIRSWTPPRSTCGPRTRW